MLGTVVTMTMVCTAYSPACPVQHTGSQTSTGRSAYLPGVAVDPDVIPYGSRVSIDGGRTWLQADDTGGAIRGRRLDVRLRTYDECIAFGRQTRQVIVRTYTGRSDWEPVARHKDGKQTANAGTLGTPRVIPASQAVCVNASAYTRSDALLQAHTETTSQEHRGSNLASALYGGLIALVVTGGILAGVIGRIQNA